MTIGATIATFFLAPLFAMGAFFGSHAMVSSLVSDNQSTDANVSASTSTQASVNQHTAQDASGFLKTNGNVLLHTLVPKKSVSPSTTVSIFSITPASGEVGASVTITGSGFTNDTTVLMDGLVAAREVGFANGTITFTIPNSLAPDCKANEACPMFMRLLTAGTYAVTIENANGTSNAVNLTVTGGNPIISPAQPMQPVNTTGSASANTSTSL